jgi:hypothetical protein
LSTFLFLLLVLGRASCWHGSLRKLIKKRIDGWPGHNSCRAGGKSPFPMQNSRTSVAIEAYGYRPKPLFSNKKSVPFHCFSPDASKSPKRRPPVGSETCKGFPGSGWPRRPSDPHNSCSCDMHAYMLHADNSIV